MLYFLVRVFVNALALWLTLTVLPGMQFNLDIVKDISARAAVSPEILLRVVPFLEVLFTVIVAMTFGFVNWLLWPIILLFTGQIVIWTFGLFLIIVNAAIFFFLRQGSVKDRLLSPTSRSGSGCSWPVC
jgi:uncharacterized membrane protein YvlD (DUF360 family)